MVALAVASGSAITILSCLRLRVPASGTPICTLLLVGSPADVSWLVVPAVVDAVDCHALGTKAQLIQPLLKRLEAELDVGVGAFMVRLAALLGLVVAVASAQEGWVVLDTSALALAFAALEGTAATGPDAALTVELVNSDTGLLAALAGHVRIVPSWVHRKRGSPP